MADSDPAAAAAAPVRFKSNYAATRKIEPFYKGGRIQISRDRKFMFCPCGSKVNVIDVETGAVLHSLQQDEEEDVTAFVLSPDDEVLVTGSRALLLRRWRWREPSCERSWRAVHTAPVATMAFDPTATLLATGGCDSTIKVWDMVKHYCTHNLKGSSGVVHLVEFHPDTSRLQLFSSSIDYKIRIWDLRSSKCVAVLEGHFSAVTSLAFADGNSLLSSGRDKICMVWDLETRQSKRTVPVYETVEAAVLLPKEGDFSQLGVKKQGLHFVTAGSKGILRVWEVATAACVHSQAVPFALREEPSERSLSQCQFVPARNEILTVSMEHNILFYDAQSLQLRKQLAGYNEEVLDVKFLGPGDSHIVVATNSPQLKVFELATSHCQILYGHTETILALDVFRKGRMFVTCAKDRSVRLWRMGRAGRVTCVAQGLGHAHGVGAVACSRLKESFVVTSSQDCTIKIWNIPESLTSKAKAALISSPEPLHARVTERGHDKDINSVAVSPNDKLLATGSQDRLAKLWSCSDCSLLGVFSGHKRGIWCVQFSPVDQVLATSSADGTLKLWGLRDFSCLKTFEGHDASVLKIIFVSRGAQLLSSGSDGLLKLWTIKTNECVKTLDGHEDKIWGLHSNKKDDMVVTASSDSCITLWQDVTEIEEKEAQAKQEEQIMKEQELSNLLHEKRYLKALGLAISLDRPHTVLTVVKAILREPEGRRHLDENIVRLRKDQKEAVLAFLVTWNTNSRNCHEAQAVLETLLRHEAPDTLLQFSGIKSAVESLLPYTERHFQRLSRLLQASTFIEFMWHNMRLADVAQQDQGTL
ncbi:transducin beta-like protein 3 [Molothrus ater]|nr:transducin beta-like protein 3 [Molothrus ater]